MKEEIRNPFNCISSNTGHYQGGNKDNTLSQFANVVDDEIKSISWTTFISSCVEPELIEYLKERRIYVNEPVDSEEDI